MQSPRRAAVGALALATVFALAACNQNDNGNNTLAGHQDSPTPPGGPQSTAPAQSPAPGGPIPVEAKDFAFAPKAITAKAGTITIALHNTGAAPHTFTSGDLKVDVNADAGKDATITINDAKAGTYKFVCKYHEGQGMVGELTVT